jgi:transcription initiation factor TFIIH subunit 3
MSLLNDGANNNKSLLVVIIDVTPKAWGERELRRKVSDQKRLASNKPSIGPARLSSDLLPAIVAFLVAFASLHRENCVVVIAAAGNETAVIYPRKGGPNPKASMVHMVNDSPEMCGTKVDARTMHDMIHLGIAESVVRATKRAELAAAAAAKLFSSQGDEDIGSTGKTSFSEDSDTAAITAALSLALCSINRYVASALGGFSSSNMLLKRREDEGVLSMIEASHNTKKTNPNNSTDSSRGMGGDSAHDIRAARGVPSSRILVLQATSDRTKDYNALMNCTFAAAKGDILIDGCFFPMGVGKKETSTFLEQACDRTGGVYLAPTGAAQVEGALTQVLVSVFLPSNQARKQMNLPALTEVDFRSRCFETGESVDIAYVCNSCLSIFKRKPAERCHTCGASATQT